MTAGSADPVRLALLYVTRLADLVEACRDKICGEVRGDEECRPGAGIARRASDLPGLVASAGLVPALTFYMSKADGYLLKSYIELLGRGDAGNPGDQLCGRAADDLGWREKAGYTAVLATAARGLIDLGYLEEPGDDADAVRWLAEGLKSLRGSSREVVAERRMLDFLVEVKKLAAAFFKTQEETG